MKPAVYLLCACFLLLFAYLVFRCMVRRDYRERGRRASQASRASRASRAALSPLASILQLLVFLAYFFFPYLYNPAGWADFWLIDDSPMRPFQLAGLILIGHWMILTEEEHLSRQFGEEYQRYCSEVPRYLFR